MPTIIPNNIKKGFTLLELVVTLGVLAFLLKISVPRLYNLQVETTLDTAARQVTQAVARAETVAQHPNINNNADQSMKAGGIIDRNDIKTYLGTILTIEDAIPALVGRERLTIREWSAPRPDITVGKTDAATVLPASKIKTDDTNYPASSSVILSDRTAVTKFVFHWMNDNSDDPAVNDGWPLEEIGPPVVWYIPFAAETAGRPTGEPFGKIAPVPVSPQVVQPHVLLTLKRDKYTPSCRLITIDLTNGGTSSRSATGTACD